MICGCENIDWSSTGSMLSGISAIAAVCLAYWQLRKINASLNDTNVMKILEIEFELNRLKERAMDIGQKLIENTPNKSQEQYTLEEKNVYKNSLKFYEAAYEHYYNCLERLCRFIVIKKFDEKDFNDDYKIILNSAVSDDIFKSLKPNINYPNIVALQARWSH